MKPRHAAAFALVGWYLMLPPAVMPKTGDPITWITYDSSAPIYQWNHMDSFDHAGDCEAARKALLDKTKENASIVVPEKMSQADVKRSLDERVLNAVSAECIATDDPRLKEK
jgi:hypothetical protein